MKRPQQLNLTSGAILPLLTRLTLPIIGSSFLQMLYNLTDMFWLGRLNAASLAGAGIGGFMLWIMSSLGTLTRSAAITAGSNARGKKNDNEILRIAALMLFWTLLLSAAITAVLLTSAKSLIALFSLADSAANGEALRYIRISAAGSLFLLLFPALSSFSIGQGDSRTPFTASLVSVGLNIVLDPLLIFTFGMEAAGAAWATVSANLVGTLILIRPLAPWFRLTLRPKLYLYGSRNFLRLGLPQCAESTLYAGFTMVVGMFLGRFGARVLAANSLGAQVESLTWMIAVGLGSAATSFIGQNWGATRYDRILRGYKSILLITLAYSIAIAIWFYFFPGAVSSIFTDQPDVHAKSIEYFRILAWSQPLMAIEIAIGGAFRGIQKPGFPAVVSAIITLTRLPLSWLCLRAGFSYQAIWWIISGTSIAKGLVIGGCFIPMFKLALAATGQTRKTKSFRRPPINRS